MDHILVLIKLQSKGFSHEQATNIVNKISPKFNQRKTIDLLIKKRYKYLNISNPKDKQKLFNILMRKGFDKNNILESIGAYD